MEVSSLSGNLHLSPSQLYVGDLTHMRQFYSTVVGLETLETSAERVLLGDGDTAALELIAKPSLKHANPRDAGLFHNALLYSSKGALAKSVASILEKSPSSFSGTADHLVSEAFYFNDPEGNGLEMYVDRPRDEWTWVNGHVQMDTIYIDPLTYLYKNVGINEHNSTTLGHIHLRVGDITTARQFYVDTLGFTITAAMPGALFVSVGGYHHHIGLNTWMSDGAPVRPKSLGLHEVTIQLSSHADVARLASRLEAKGARFTYVGDMVHVADPWGTLLAFTATT